MLSEERIKGIVELYNNNFLFKNDTNALKLENDFNSIIKLFTQYACADFAFAVNVLTGWKSYEFYNDEEDGYTYHVVSKHPTKDIFFDINGFLTKEDISKKYFNNHTVHSYDVGLTCCSLQDKKEQSVLQNLISELIAKGWSEEYRETIN